MTKRQNDKKTNKQADTKSNRPEKPKDIENKSKEKLPMAPAVPDAPMQFSLDNSVIYRYMERKKDFERERDKDRDKKRETRTQIHRKPF